MYTLIKDNVHNRQDKPEYIGRQAEKYKITTFPTCHTWNQKRLLNKSTYVLLKQHNLRYRLLKVVHLNFECM